jgi:hypothetical protein
MIPRFLGSIELIRMEIYCFFRLVLLALLLVLGVGLAACSSLPGVPTLPPSVPPNALGTPSPMVVAPTATPSIYPWTDESAVMSGLCYESVYDAAERTFAIRSDAELTAFFDLADNSELCRHPVQRGSFDFTGGRLLIGLWSKTIGCTAQHEVSNIQRDDVAKIYAISLRLVVQVGCNYELVRPFWIGLSDLSGYDVRLLVQR